MNKRILILSFALGLIACESQKPDFIIEGKIEGLKKGKLYLQKIKDSTIVNIDSVKFYNNNQFRFERKLDYPDVMYLQLQKDTIEKADNFVSFFADKGNISVNAELNKFMFAEVKGDYPNQKKFQEYSKTIKRFGDQKLDLIKAEIEARKSSNQDKLDSVNEAYNNMNRRRYLYAVNFALVNPELEVSPYIVINQAKYISKNYLDTIYSGLNSKVQKSYYGIKLKELIDEN